MKDQLQQLCQIADRYFAGRRILVLVDTYKSKSVKWNASTDRDRIVIVGPELDSPKRWAMVKALNLHELGHCLFSESNELKRDMKTRKAWNLLEDQRVENIMVRLYPGSRKYFVLAATELLRDPILLWGRRHFLPFRVARPQPPRVAEIIDEYLATTPSDIHKRISLARELAKYLPDVELPVGEYDNLGSKREADKRGKENLREVEEQVAEEMKGKLESGESEDEVAGCHESLQPPQTEEVAEAQEAIEEIERQIGGVPRWSPSGVTHFDEIPVSQIEVPSGLVPALYEIFRQMKLGLRGIWTTRERSGRIDLRRAMQPTSGIKIFKRWHPSQQYDKWFDLTLLFDKSGSMIGNDPNRLSLRCAYALSLAADRIGIRNQVVAFGSEAKFSKQFHERGFTGYRYGGGTNVLEAIKLAKPEETRNPVTILLTDGEFGGQTEEVSEVLRKMRSFVILVNTENQLGDGVRVYKLRSISGLPQVLQKIAGDLAKEVLSECGGSKL